MNEHPFRALTAREALLAIRIEAASTSGSPSAIIYNISQLAESGLDLSGMENFTTTDRLADRLAEAHDLLRKIEHGHYEPESLTPELRGALALPPDLEAMVERRIGPKR